MFYMLVDLGFKYVTMAYSKKSACSVGEPGLIPGLRRPSGEKNATHPSILAWKISWTEHLGRLQSMRCKRVGHK